MPGFTNVHEEHVETPFGSPSDAFVLGELEGRKVAFLARHGRGHRILPSELNFRANIYAFKKLGVERIISVSAVGSLKEEHKPTDLLLVEDHQTVQDKHFFVQLALMDRYVNLSSIHLLNVGMQMARQLLLQLGIQIAILQ